MIGLFERLDETVASIAKILDIPVGCGVHERRNPDPQRLAPEIRAEADAVLREEVEWFEAVAAHARSRAGDGHSAAAARPGPG